MATPLSAQTVVDILKAEGITVQEYSNWRTHNRNHVGLFGPVYGVVIHHTVSSGDDGSVALCYNGHSNLPGPLCHGVGRNDGKIALVGHGRANHAGSGDDDVLAAVIAETALPADNETNTDGNRYFYGLEIVNLGNGTDTYPWVQYVAAVKWAAAHCRKHGWNEKSVIGHKEWQPGKIDPYGPVIGPDGTRFDFTMARFRADVKAALALPAGKWQGTVQEEDEVTPADIAAIADAVYTKLLKTDGVLNAPPDAADVSTNPYWTWESHVQDVTARVRSIEKKVDFLTANRQVAPWQYKNEAVDPRDMRQIVDDIDANVAALSTGGVDLDALAAKVADLLSQRLAS
jgi:hypothetical protein